MNIFSTFLNIAKKETVQRSGIKGLIKDMHEDVVAYRKEKQTEESPSVPREFTPDDFRNAYKTLQLNTMVSSAFLSFMIAYIFTSEDFIGFFSIGAFLVIGLFWHFSFVIRAYRARIVFENWDKRLDPFNVTVDEVFESIFTNPLIVFPFFCPLPSQKQLKNVNMKKKENKNNR